ERKKDGPQRQGEGRLPTPLLSLGYSRSRPMLGFVVGDDTTEALFSNPCQGKLNDTDTCMRITATNEHTSIAGSLHLFGAELSPRDSPTRATSTWYHSRATQLQRPTERHNATRNTSNSHP
ncbi:unnamed protein product, partial [Ectocarpus sp. 8 AP-2014]